MWFSSFWDWFMAAREQRRKEADLATNFYIRDPRFHRLTSSVETLDKEITALETAIEKAKLEEKGRKYAQEALHQEAQNSDYIRWSVKKDYVIATTPTSVYILVIK